MAEKSTSDQEETAILAGDRRFGQPLKNARCERFCQLIAEGKKTEEAYRLAGYSPHRGNACRMRAREDISIRVEEIQAAYIQMAGVDASRVFQEMARVALADPRKVFDSSGEPIPVHQLGDDIAAAVSEVEFVSTKKGMRLKKVKLWNKNDAIKTLATHLGMLKDKEGAVSDLAGELATFLKSLNPRSPFPIQGDDSHGNE